MALCGRHQRCTCKSVANNSPQQPPLIIRLSVRCRNAAPAAFLSAPVTLSRPCTCGHRYYAPPLIGGGIKRCFCLTSVCRVYIGPKSRTERPRKTKIGTGVAHVTSDSDTTFKVKRSKVKVTTPLYSPRP